MAKKKKKSKKNVVTIQADLALEFGPHKFHSYFGDEIVYQSPVRGKKLRDSEWLRDVEQVGNISYICWNKKEGRESVSATVHTTVAKLKKLVAIAERDGKKFAKVDKKAGRKLGGYFKHFGNVSFFFTGKP